MQQRALSTGIPSLDTIIDQVMLGDNIVWLVSSPEQYDYFAARFVQHCVQQDLEFAYVHFDPRVNYADLPGAQGAEVLTIDPAAGPQAACAELVRHIEARNPAAHYLFDNLSLLCAAWGNEDAFVDFFLECCPLLYDMEAVAYFALVRGMQSNKTVAKVRDTAQVLLDVYEEEGVVCLQPIKVWDRYSDTMFHVHALSGGQLVPVRSVPSLAERLGASRTRILSDLSGRAEAAGSMAIREELVRSTVSDRPDYIRIARDYLSVGDILKIKSRIIGSGTIGGKAAGMLLSNRILRAACAEDRRRDIQGQLKEPESFFIGSDVYFNFLINNNLLHWLDLKYGSPDEIREACGELRADFQAGRLPRAIREALREVIAAFRSRPLIVRSSSLLEDSFNMAFAGKYESVFLGNQGNEEACLDRLLSAVKTVYASSLGPDALTYRKRHGLLEFQEHMAVLIQAVEGRAYHGLHFPDVAGVAFSRNPYPWSERIDRNAGLVRLVFGLGTRAVDRTGSDYPRLVALSHPALYPDGAFLSGVRYHQKLMDAVDLAADELRTVRIGERVEGDHPTAFYVFSIFDGGFARAPVSRMLPREPDKLTVTFQNLIARTNFVELMRYVLERVERSYHYPVDIEFTLEFAGDGRPVLCLLQCRPLTQRTEFQPGRIPEGLPQERVLFITRRGVTNGEVHNVRYIVLIDSRHYDAMASDQARSRLARAVGALNDHESLIGGGFVLIGPGRWGSTNIRLGVPVSYAEISNTRILMEMARQKDGHTPEVSYGTHFFQDLVESEIFYLPLYPDEPASTYNEGFLSAAGNRLGELAPQYADLAGALKVIDVPRESEGLYLHVAMNQEESTAVGYLAPPCGQQ